MSKFSEAEKQAILEQARATLACPMPEPSSPEPASVSETWKDRAEKLEAAREKHKHESEIAAIERRIEGQLRAMLTASFKGMIEAEHQYLLDHLLPELFNELRNAIADSVRLEITNEYKTSIAELRAELAALEKQLGGEAEIITELMADLAALKKQLGGAEVVDLLRHARAH